MLKKIAVIMWHDRADNPFRIFAKSYARYRRYGFGIMCKRINEEYRALHPYDMFGRSAREKYHEWIAKEESTPTDRQPSARPLISVIVPVYKTELRYLEEMLESVLSQSYGNWELCIVDDASGKREIEDLLREYARRDSRIKLFFREENGHISKACNSALEMAEGEYAVFLDHDDRIRPNALHEIALAISENPDLKLIYSDEDKIDERGKRYDPHFKPEWNRDLFYSQNYIAHLAAIDMRLMKELGGFREGFEGSQDYDLYLRVIERIDDSQIHHIDKILYHWRATKGSTAKNPEAKSYSTVAGVRALSHHFRNHEGVVVTRGMLPNTYKVDYPVPPAHPPVTIIIPTRDGGELLRRCVESVYDKSYYINFEILIVDNQSEDRQTLDYLRRMEREKENFRVIEYDRAFNYSAINNYAVSRSDSDILILLNDDVEIISENWMMEMVQHALRSDIGAVGAKLYYDNGTIQHAGVVLGIGGVAGHGHKYFPRKAHGYFSRLKLIQNCSAVTGACMAVRRELYEEIGGLDEENLPIAFNDVDFCLRLGEAGYRNLWTPYAEAYHHESASRGVDNTPAKLRRFASEIEYMKRRWGDILTNDPYYSRHLTLEHEDFSIDLR